MVVRRSRNKREIARKRLPLANYPHDHDRGWCSRNPRRLRGARSLGLRRCAAHGGAGVALVYATDRTSSCVHWAVARCIYRFQHFTARHNGRSEAGHIASDEELSTEHNTRVYTPGRGI